MVAQSSQQVTAGSSGLKSDTVQQTGSHNPLIGALIDDRYQVIGELGSGGMSTVYKVRHRHLDKIFALKVLHETSEVSLQRFMLEGQASTLLHHPNIVTVHDLGIHQGRAFMILDFVEGRSLEDVIKEDGPIEPRRAMRIFGQICSALAHAHEQGVVHRDIKPSNIIVSKVGADLEHVVVLDFGIAKILKPSDTAEAQNLTRTGEVFGTPLYMSPEQCEGRVVDARTDIYALGCVMYETLTGKPPFQGYNFFNTIYKQIKEAPPPFPSALRKTRIGVHLECIVLKAMAKAPQNRHKFMLELSSDLKEVELGTTGTVGNVFSSLKLMAGRLNAIERTRFLLSSTMQAMTILAFIMGAGCVFLPDKIVAAGREAARNQGIIDAVNFVIKRRFDTESVLSLDKDDMNESVAIVQKLCLPDAQQLKISEDFAIAADEGFAESQKIPDLFKEIIFSQDPGAIRGVKRSLNRAVKHWTHASKLSSELVSLSYNKLSRMKESMSLMLSAFEICKWGGVLLEIGLLAIIVQSFRNIRRQKSDKAEVIMAGPSNAP